MSVDLLQAAGAIAATAAGVGGVAYLGRGGYRASRAVHRLVDLVAGRPERWPGDPEARPGVAQRLETIDAAIADVRSEVAAIDAELHPNSGSSLRDQVDATRDQVAQMARATGADTQ